MTKRDKLKERLLVKPRDFTWDELMRLLTGFGYEQISGGKTGGSRVRFIHEKYSPIILHKPHPKPLIKRYLLDMVIDLLRQEGVL